MKRFLPILFFTGLLVGQDTLITISGQLVATFSDPKKQFEFEKKKIYLNDKESVPFSMERNGIIISELELLSLLSLEEERNEIINIYKQQILEYERKYDEWEKNDDFKIEYDTEDPFGHYFGSSELCSMCLLTYTCMSGTIALLEIEEGFYQDEEVNMSNIVIHFGVILGIYIYQLTATIKSNERIVWLRGPAPKKPKQIQTLSNNQIKGLVNTYNRNLYNQLRSSK